jgi:hypothetical protein
VGAAAASPEEEEEGDMDAEALVAEVGNLLNFAVGSTIGAIGGAWGSTDWERMARRGGECTRGFNSVQLGDQYELDSVGKGNCPGAQS